MPMIQCPECGTHIASKACMCPYCGYIGDDPRMPIGAQTVYDPAPQLQFEIERWDSHKKKIDTECVDLAPEDNMKIWDTLKNWKQVQAMLPALAEAVLGMARSEKQWIADIPKYYEQLLKDGQITFRPDKNGQILPHLVGKDGRIVKQVRLKEIVSMPELLPNLQHLETQAALAMIMSQLENVQEQIAQIRGELQQDRLAKADAAWDQLNQALKITDGRRREQAVIIAIGTGTEAKHTLMRHFASCLHLIEGNADQNEARLIIGDIFKGKSNKERGEIEARMAYDDLVGILNCVRVETEGHMAIGDTEAARRSLKEFATFIETEQLDDRDTILKIDSRLPSAQKRPEIVDEFDAIAQRTMQLSALTAGESVPKQLLEAYRPPQDDEDEKEDAIAETDEAAEPSVAVTVTNETIGVESYEKEEA
ncbi:zinc ribbon domain-containing protein [Bifidobacterium pseudolongum]|uniref:zinc ribbon domain-containing protein n=1 Tax=Bifidobacterium pseudolongum TaxID=1694 RepID=UPI001F0F959A|nr:zinc ribbon domain-containing protein [Bifidobacterium pseudolongum]MCH4842666.1 zinc ribbon domain-containing protein [Bifidobacterium pseudolongum]